MTTNNPKVKEPYAPADIEAAIVEISNSVKRMNATRLKQDTIVTLIHAHSRVGKKDIQYVLNTLATLEAIYLKPAPK